LCEQQSIPSSSNQTPYSLTLHAPGGTRLVGFDNAHGIAAPGSRFKRPPPASDHWHRTESNPGRPYAYKDADTLLQDFFREVRRVLSAAFRSGRSNRSA
jgi:hypothetical protein